MNKRILFITPADASQGFSLAGFEHQVCTGEELEPIIEKFVRENEYGLFVIDERLVSPSIDNRLREMERGLDLVFVYLPPPIEVDIKREDYGVRLLRRAIGYHVQLNL